MKKYIGTKVINAMPMSRQEYNDFRGWELPQDENGADEGYLVEYIDGGKANTSQYKGYVSWSPKEVFDKAYRVAESHVDRMLIEKDDLSIKLESASVFVKSENFREVVKSDYQVAMLCLQISAMQDYHNVLSGRLLGEGDEPLCMGFGLAIDALKSGCAIRRTGWNGKGMFVVKQIPAHITEDIIPKMQSLPKSAKDIVMARENKVIDYTNQMLIVHPDGRADSWVPSVSDVFAEDWVIVR